MGFVRLSQHPWLRHTQPTSRHPRSVNWRVGRSAGLAPLRGLGRCGVWRGV